MATTEKGWQGGLRAQWPPRSHTDAGAHTLRHHPNRTPVDRSAFEDALCRLWGEIVSFCTLVALALARQLQHQKVLRAIAMAAGLDSCCRPL